MPKGTRCYVNAYTRGTRIIGIPFSRLNDFHSSDFSSFTERLSRKNTFCEKFESVICSENIYLNFVYRRSNGRSKG